MFSPKNIISTTGNKQPIDASTRTGGWGTVGIFLAIALSTLIVLSILLRKTDPSHLTIGSMLVLVLYGSLVGFLVLAARLFISPHKENKSIE